MTASPDWLPAIDANAAAAAIRDGIQKLTESGVFKMASGVATAEPTWLVGGVVIGTLAETKLVEYSRIADRRLEQYIEETDADEQAYRVKLAKGISHLLPKGFGDAAIDAARGNPDNLRRLMDEYYAGEGRSDLDDAVNRILSGDIDDLGTELCEAFGTDDVYEAQALFLDFRDLIEARQVQETLETVLDLEGRFVDLKQELEDTRGDLRESFQRLWRGDLRKYGFVRLTPVEFDREINDPEAAWRAGFDLIHVRGRRAEDDENGNEENNRQSFAADRDGIHDDDWTATGELLSALRDGDDRLVVGRAGSGKSTICKSVACEWYDEPDTGAVFYRESGRGDHFTNSGPLVGAVRESDGHTLVVVEDAVRASAEGVYEAITDLRGESVSFLLDARRGDVERFGEPGEPETGAQGKLAEAYRNITRYPLNERLSKEVVKAVFDQFEATTGRDVQASPNRIQAELERGGDIGQMLFLSYFLPVGGEGGGLFNDVENKYQTIRGEAEGSEHWTDITAFDPNLRQDVALTTALLIATGVGNHPELLHALGEKHGRDKAVHEEIDDIRDALEGWFVYPTDDPDAAVPATTHELWATLYLQQEAESLEAEREGREDRFGTPDPNRFHTCLAALYAVVDDETFREYLADAYPDSTVLLRVDDGPTEFAKQVAIGVLELGEDRPALAPLFEFGTDREVPAPSVCERKAVAQIEAWKGRVCLRRGAYNQARVHIGRSRDLFQELGDRQGVANSLINLGAVAQSQGNYDDARDYYRQSRSIFEELGDRQGIANSLGNLGIISRIQDGYDDARDYHRQSLKIKKELGDRQGIANSLGNLGLVAQSQGEYDQAHEYHRQSLEIKEELGDRRGIANSLNNLGLVAQSQGEYDQAHEYHHQSLEIKEELGNQRGVAGSLNNLGTVAESQDDYDQARDYYRRSRRLFEELGDRQGIASSLGNLGSIAESQGDYDDALEHHRQSRKLFEELGDRQGIANSLINLGAVAQSRGNYDDAVDYHLQSHDIHKELGDRQGIANSLINLGAVAQSQGDYDDARDYYRRSRRLFEELGDRQGIANSLENLGTVAKSQGDYDDARDYYWQSLEIKEELGDRQGIANSLNNLGVVARNQGDYDDARDYHRQSLEIKEEFGDQQGIANSLENLGLVAQSQGDYDNAHSYHRQSLEIREELGDRQSIANALNNLGTVALSRGDYDDARDYYQQSLEIEEELGDRQGIANSLGNLGLVARNQYDYHDARDYHRQSLKIKKELGDRQGIANSLNNLGLVAQSQGDYDDARDYHRQSLEIKEELGDRQGIASNLNNLGAVAKSQGDYDDARDYFRRANEQLSEIGALRNAVTSLRNLVDVCERMGDIEAAVEWCGRAREWTESIDQIDLSNDAKWFEERRRELVSDGTDE
ncbi:tetratricopeptide repeat protein [Halorubrum sp. Hd13]|uniref:tetratricopeptide repeat protein n=1 Tax=Halorubrum sp. Hd13 TaxID=1480728 RepID=UPI000B9836AA|nr:tetratricopeptide repeat protein [Halorubrum sp. Hd13]OYR45261.1 hypothetical protein DJ81_05295 [Halorubrum sp. Hd13]